MAKGILIVVSAPAGCGKDTILEQALKANDNLFYSVSATSRAMRPGETDGVSYHFKSREQFEEMIKNGECGVFSEKLMACFEFARPDMEKIVVQTKAAEAAEKNA